MILDGRLVLTDRLQSQLGTLVSAVEIAGQNNLSSSHVVAETTLAGLLNRVYGGAAGDLIAAFLKDSALSPEEAQRLRNLLEQMEV